MTSRTLTGIAAITLLSTLSIPTWLAAQEQRQEEKEHVRYAVTDLGLAADWIGGANAKGWLDYTTPLPDGTVHGSLLRRGRRIDLGTLGGPNSFPTQRASESGQVIGQAETSTLDPLGEDFCGHGTHLICLGFVWQNGVMTPLRTLEGNNASATHINERGEIVGYAETNKPDPTCPPPQLLQTPPVIWKNGEIHELPTVSGDPDGAAFGVNDHGQAVGESGNCTTPFHAVLWQEDGNVRDLGNLGGANFNYAQQINNRGQVVGLSALAGDTTHHGYLWTEDSGMKDLGTLPGDFSSGALAINDKGQIVGLSSDVNHNLRAFLWQDGAMTDLNQVIPSSFPFVLVEAFDINARGEIIGLAVDPKRDETHAFLAIPCDEERANRKGCANEDTAVAPGESSEKPKVSIPANIRKLLQPLNGPGFFREEN